MSSYYDGQPRPPKQPPLADRAKAAADKHVPLFYDPSYDEKPASKHPEFLVIGVVVIIGVLVFVWALSIFRGVPEVEDLGERQSFQDEQMYHDIIERPYTVPSADWNLDGVTDTSDLTYFDEVVYNLPYETVRSMAREVADSTYPEIAEEQP